MKTCQDGCDPPQKLFIAEIKPVNANGGCDDNQDVAFDTPFYDETLKNNTLVVPAINEDFILRVPMASRWYHGQWLYIEGIGKFNVVKTEGKYDVVLRNVIETEIVGKSYSGQRKVWIVDSSSPLAADAAATELVTKGMAADAFDFCATTSESVAADTGNPMVALSTDSLCEPCSTKDDKTRSVKCFRFFRNIVFKFLTIALPKIPETALSQTTYKVDGADVTNPLLEVLWHPQSGDLYKRKKAARPAIDVHDGAQKKHALVPTDYGSKLYFITPNRDDGTPEWREFTGKLAMPVMTTLANGSVDIKASIETALGITLPTVGQIQILITGKRLAVGHSSVARVDVTADSVILCSTEDYDCHAVGSRVITIDLAAPTIVLANGDDFFLDVAYIPANMTY